MKRYATDLGILYNNKYLPYWPLCTLSLKAKMIKKI